ncbi:hypothetical protein O9929_13730 [Vibrio lentus]|nr:hypothetical protein [Vibrio lentus]
MFSLINAHRQIDRTGETKRAGSAPFQIETTGMNAMLLRHQKSHHLTTWAKLKNGLFTESTAPPMACGTGLQPSSLPIMAFMKTTSLRTGYCVRMVKATYSVFLAIAPAKVNIAVTCSP